jgi:hypothetical protein
MEYVQLVYLTTKFIYLQKKVLKDLETNNGNY